MKRLPFFLLIGLTSASACDNDPGEGKVAASVQEVSQTQTPAPPANEAAKPASPTLAATHYAFDESSSKIEFVGAKITGKHDGSFKSFNGTIQTAAGAATGGSVSLEIDVASLEADAPKLTAHLKSPDLLDAAQFPKARFSSTAITPKGAEDQFTVTGNFELHGVTKQIGFPATIRVQPERVEADAEFSINRNDFGIVYPGKPDDLIQDNVLIKLNIRAAQQDGPPPTPTAPTAPTAN